MNAFRHKMLPLISALLIAVVCLAPAQAFAEGGRATFKKGREVCNAWASLAGSKSNVKAIRQYQGDAVPDGVETQVVSTDDSAVPIYSWFEDGVIYYWSEDPAPYTNADASYMFNGFTNASAIDVGTFDTSMTTDMEAMFANCSKVEALDVSSFDTSNVRCMYCMFYGCSSLKELNVSHFNTTNTTSTSDQGYGSICGMFFSCSSLTELDLSSFDMTRLISWPYNVQNMFPGCTNLSKLVLGPNVRFNSHTALSGSWTHEGDGLTLSGNELCIQYTAANAFSYSGTWIRNMPEGHYYRTDGSLGETNLWEVHTPSDRFKGYCLNLNKFGVGEELDRILAEDDSAIVELLCTENEGSVHGCEPLGSTLREALITLIYYGWPNDAAGIQQRYGLSDQEFLEITQNAVWDFTDRYDEPAGPTLYEGASLAAYNDLVGQRYANIEGSYILFLYKSWDPSKQNLLSIMGVDDQAYGGVQVKKQNATGSENLAGAEFTVFDADGTPVGTMVTSANGAAYICRTDHTAGLPLGEYTVRETKPPAGYILSDVEYHFEITEANQIVTVGWRNDPENEGSTIEEEMIFFDDHDDEYVGGGLGITKESNTGKKLVGAEFTIYDSENNVVKTLITNNSGVAATGKQDLPLGTYTVVETKAPDGYVLSSTAQTVEITEDFQFLTLTFQDAEKLGSITLQAHKQLEVEGKTLEAGMFTFQLLDAHNNVIQTATNDAEGNVTFNPIQYTPDDLGYKNYHIVEVIGSESGVRYDRHSEDVTVTIYDTGADTLSCTAIYDSDGAVFTNTNGDTKYDVEIFKRKLHTDDIVEGAILEIRDVSGRLIGSWTSSGEAYVVTLDPGTYTLREITAPKGYFECSDVTFEVSETGELSADSDAVSVSGLSLSIYDRSVASTELKLKKVAVETGLELSGAEFTLKGEDSSYSSVVTTDDEGIALFEGLETGTYTLSETAAPQGYRATDGPWTVIVVYNRAISKTANVSSTGTASGDYPSEEFDDTITLPGSPESIHIELKYQTEDGYDYLTLLDGDGNVITHDINGTPIGDSREEYKGRFWGGADRGVINTLAFDLAGDSVTFHFFADSNTAAYGYYAVVTSETTVSVTNSEGEDVEPEQGLYTFENQEDEAAAVTLGGTKRLEGRDLREGEFSFELVGPGGEVASAANAADGTYAFPELSFTEEGTYGYTVREVAGDEEGVTYDARSYSVTVTVARGEGGALAATVSGDSSTGRDLDFTNTYTEKKRRGDERTTPKTADGNASLSSILSLALLGCGLLAYALFLDRRTAHSRRSN